jgi:hypothetical protein
LTTSEFEVAAFEAGQFVTIAKKQVEAEPVSIYLVYQVEDPIHSQKGTLSPKKHKY